MCSASAQLFWMHSIIVTSTKWKIMEHTPLPFKITGTIPGKDKNRWMGLSLTENLENNFLQSFGMRCTLWAPHSCAENCNERRLVIPCVALTAIFLPCRWSYKSVFCQTIWKVKSFSGFTTALHSQARQRNAGIKDEAISSASSFSVTTDWHLIFK